MNKKQIVVIGAGRFGSSFAATAQEIGHDVLIIDRNKERIDAIADFVTHAVTADVTVEGVLEDLGISNFDIAVIAMIADYQATIMSTLICKEMGIPTIIAKAKSEIHARVLTKIGATKTVFPERDSGIRLAHSLTSRNILEIITLSDEYDVMEIKPLRSWVGKKIKEIGIASRIGLNVIAVKVDDEVQLNPGAEFKIQEDSTLIVLGHKDSIHKFENMQE